MFAETCYFLGPRAPKRSCKATFGAPDFDRLGACRDFFVSSPGHYGVPGDPQE